MIREAVKADIAKVAVDPKKLEHAEKIIKRILNNHLNNSNESRQIAEDALSTATMKLLSVIDDRPDDWWLFERFHSEKGEGNCLVTGYLLKSVKRYALYRKEYWGDSNDGNPNLKARAIPTLGKSDGVDDVFESLEDWLSYNADVVALGLGPDNDDIPKTIELLKCSGMKEEDISLILLRSEGYTFDEIGSKLNAKKDAVRMRYNRAQKLAATLLAP